MPAPKEVLELIERFERNRDAYRSHEYNEAQVRLELINPFFKALGWDVYNEAGYAEAYKDVVHEDAIKVGGHAKAPDYSFRIGGTRKFFVEAKRPSVGIKDNIDAAYQLRRYAWSAKLPLSILTDFEEFAVYDCRVKPAKTDKASAARVLYLTVEEYADQWDEIASIFSQEAILTGSFDRYVESTKRKRGTAEVDDAFLKEIENWRDVLARNIALRNADLSTRELNFAVQRTIDRIIFLRICEDRGIEDYGQLMALQSGNRVYPRLCQILRRADERYNSGLFHFRKEKDRPEPPDDLTLSLTVDDKVLKEVFEDLYYPDSPYEFSVLPADILGHIYEQFLGKLIRLTPGHHAKVDDKPEVKKAGGVYYTPTYIVDYIVKHTVGKLLDGKTPQQVRTLYVLDPACGSGSFLLGAYQTLLDWHLDWYSQHDPEKHAKGRKPKIFHGPGGDWRLTTAEKKRILLNNIYGVDIDPQAVEVTKLSLLLKVLEGENEETIGQSLRLFHQRALPDLGENIKCGNSLIGPDFYEGKQLSLIDEEERYRINAFDWNAEFPEIMQAGGFDSVIGNPPYSTVTHEKLKKYFHDSFETTEGRYDTYELFVEKGLRLCNPSSCLGYIVPSTLLTNLYSRKLRQYILSNCSVLDITAFGLNVFLDPTIHTCIILLAPGRGDDHMVKVRKQVSARERLWQGWDYEIAQSRLGNNPNSTFDIFADPISLKLISKLERGTHKLEEICYMRQCIKTGNDKEYVQSFTSPPGEPWKPTWKGRSISRYSVLENDLYVKHGPWLARNWKNKAFYETPKIAVRETSAWITATLDLDGRYLLSSLYSVYPRPSVKSVDLRFLLGILNSSTATYYIKIIALGITKGAFTKIRTNQLARLPIPVMDLSFPTDKARHDHTVELVDTMLKLHMDLQAAKTDHEKSLIQRQIDATDKQIDQLVYELYALTDKEIRIVEGKSQKTQQTGGGAS